jgi:hypothetical protein
MTDDQNYEAADAVAAEVQTDIVEEVKKLSLADLAADLDKARTTLSAAQSAYTEAGAAVKAAVEAERAADKAFMAAVKDMRPKRAQRKPKAEKTDEPKAEKPKAEKKKK